MIGEEPDIHALYSNGRCRETTDYGLFDPGGRAEGAGRPLKDRVGSGLPRYPARARTAATRFCATCPVKEDCFQFAKQSGQCYGVWGGYWFRPKSPSSTTESVYVEIELIGEKNERGVELDTSWAGCEGAPEASDGVPADDSAGAAAKAS